MSREVLFHSDFVHHLDTTESCLKTEGFQHSCNPVIQLTDLEATEVILWYHCAQSWGAVALWSQIQNNTIISIPDFKDWYVYTKQLQWSILITKMNEMLTFKITAAWIV